MVAYHYGKQSALALWGSGPGYGMDPNMLLSWHYYGGGLELLQEIYKSINVDVVSFLYGPMPTQPFGWFKKPVARVEELKGIKFRTVGLAVDIYTEQGAAVNPLPGGEIVPALDRGLIDAAEFNNASSDRTLGFPDVVKNCMLQSFHQSTEQLEILFNKTKYDTPSPNKHHRCGERPTPTWAGGDPAVHGPSSCEGRCQLCKHPTRSCASDVGQVIAKKSAENPLFKKVLDSQKAFALRAGQWQNDYLVDFKMAWNYYFGRK